LANNIIIADGAGNIRLQDNNGAMAITSPLALPTYVYASRPSSPATGAEVNFSDSNSAVWGATVAGGGTHNVKARYNGSVWTVVGI
jgi:hypothetical protein